MHITSAQNSKIKLVKRLRGKRGRQQEGRFVIDYERDLRRALTQGYDIDFILTCPEFAAAPDYPACETHSVTPALFKRVSYRENPAGLIAVMRGKPARCGPHLRASEIQQAIVLVGLTVPGNIGALMRSADAAGLDAVMLVDTALDLYNPNIIRSSTGACFRDNIYQLSGAEARTFVKAEGFQLVAADVAGERAIYDIDLDRKAAIALGSEDQGLPNEWIRAADQVARIPMHGVVCDSLNVSVSGAILMYELYRQTRHR